MIVVIYFCIGTSLYVITSLFYYLITGEKPSLKKELLSLLDNLFLWPYRLYQTFRDLKTLRDEE